MLELEHTDKFVIHSKKENDTLEYTPFFYKGRYFASFEEGYKFMVEAKTSKINEKGFSHGFDAMKAEIWYRIQRNKLNISNEILAKALGACSGAFFNALNESEK